MTDPPADPPADPVEAGLLVAIDDAAPGSREVYADWLEEHADPARAELVRILELCVVMPRAPSFDAAFEALTARLAMVARDLDLAWRRRVGRDAIARCLPFADLTPALEARPARRAPGAWELPEQLRYLEDLAPAPVREPVHAPMSPRLAAMLERVAETASSRVLDSLLARLIRDGRSA